MIPKTILYSSKKYANGEYPVCIQVVYQSKAIKKTLFTIKKEHWDARNECVNAKNPIHVDYNETIDVELTKAKKRCLAAMRADTPLTFENVFGVDTSLSGKVVDIVGSFIAKKRSRNENFEKYSNLVKKLEEFLPNSMSCDVTVDWIERFEIFLLKINSRNTTSKNISCLLTTLRNSEFVFPDKVLNYKLRYEETYKDKLSLPELRRIIDLDLCAQPRMELYRDTFLLCFYLRGRRIGDILSLQKSEIKGGRVVRDALKTDKRMNILIIKEAMVLIEKYKDNSDIYVLPIIKMVPPSGQLAEQRYQKAIESKTTLINVALKIIADLAGIDKRITTHVARHTFAYLGDYSKTITATRMQEMLEHSNLDTTVHYIKNLNNSDLLDDTMNDFMTWVRK